MNGGRGDDPSFQFISDKIHSQRSQTLYGQRNNNISNTSTYSYQKQLMLEQRKLQHTLPGSKAGLHKTIGGLSRNSPQSHALTTDKSSYKALPNIFRTNDHNYNSLLIESDIPTQKAVKRFTPMGQNQSPLNAHLSRQLRQGYQSHMGQYHHVPSDGLLRANQQSSQFIMDPNQTKNKSSLMQSNPNDPNKNFKLKKDPSIQMIELTDDQVMDLKSFQGAQDNTNQLRSNNANLITTANSSFILLPQISQSIVEEQTMQNFKANQLINKNKESLFLTQFKVTGGFNKTRDPNSQSYATLNHFSQASFNATQMRNANADGANSESQSVLDQKIMAAIQGGSVHRKTFSVAPQVESTLMQPNSKQNLWNVQPTRNGHFHSKSKSLSISMNKRTMHQTYGHSSPRENTQYSNLDAILKQVIIVQDELNQQKRTEQALDRAARETDKLEKALKNDNDTPLIERVEGRKDSKVVFENKNSRTCKKDYDREMKEILGEIPVLTQKEIAVEKMQAKLKSELFGGVQDLVKAEEEGTKTANQLELQRFQKKPISQIIKDQANIGDLWSFDQAIQIQRKLKLDGNKAMFKRIKDLNLTESEMVELQTRGLGDLIAIIEQDKELQTMQENLFPFQSKKDFPGSPQISRSDVSMSPNPSEYESFGGSRRAKSTLKPVQNKKMIQAIQKSKHHADQQDDAILEKDESSGDESPMALQRKQSIRYKSSGMQSPNQIKRSKKLQLQLEQPNAFLWERELRKSKNYEDYAHGKPDHDVFKANQSYTVRRRAKLTYDTQKRTKNQEFIKVFQELSKGQQASPKEAKNQKKQNQLQTAEGILDAKFREVNEKQQLVIAKKIKQDFINNYSQDQLVISLIIMRESMKEHDLEEFATKWGKVSKKQASARLSVGGKAVKELIEFLKGEHQDSIVDDEVKSLIKIYKTNDKDNSDAFDQYVKKEDDLMAEIGETLQSKLADWKLFREAHKDSTQERNAVAPKFQYFMQCNIDHELVLPVLDYVYKKTLCLQGYTLSIGHCNALAQAFQHFDQFINRVIFDNCGIDDTEFAAILGAVKKLKDFKKIIYRRNTFHQESLDEIQELFERKIPNHLEELRIENCQIKDNITEQLVNMLYERNYLKKISLVHANLNDNSMATFCEFVDDSTHLEEIDLSFNQIIPKSFSRFLEVISTNSQIQYLNLSWNTLFDDHPFAEKQQKKQQKKDKFIIEDLDRKKDRLDIFDEDLTEAATTSIEFLVKFIKRNRVLIHADFSNTGLNEKQLWYFGRAMRRSKSLRSLHLSGNPGITNRLIDYLTERAHCIPEQPTNELDFSELPSQIQLKTLEIEHQGIDLKIQKNRVEVKYENKFKEVQQIKQIMFQKRVESSAMVSLDPEKARQIDENYESNKLTKILTFTRKLGHQNDMPGSGQWKIITKEPPGTNPCWVCDRQIYSIVFWNELIGAHQMSQFSKQDKDYILKKIKTMNSLEDDIDANPGRSQTQGFTMDSEYLNTSCPRICGQFTNWKMKRMFDIREFCDRINLGKPDIFQLCKDQGIISYNAKTLDELTTDELDSYQREVKFYFETYRNTWKDVIQTYMQYDKPNLVHANNKTSLKNKNFPLYVFPCFMRAGKHFYCVKYNLKQQVNFKREKANALASPGNTQTTFFGQSQYSQFGTTGMSDMQTSPALAKIQAFPKSLYLGQFVANFRNEPVPKYVKQFKSNVIKRGFIKDFSVFKNWKQDDGGVVRKCMEHDTRYWKCPRFIKDAKELKQVTEFVRRNFYVLKNSFLHLASHSAFPYVGSNDFTTFVRRANILEAQLPQSTVDRYFLQVNVEVGGDQGDNPDKQLVRFEYIELMLRIAIEKYKRLGSAQTICQALEMLIENNLKPYTGYEEWQGFRDNELWTLDVNDLLQANLEKLRKVYNHFTTNTVRRMSFNNILELFMEKSELQMTVKEITLCYGMSKMTMPDENNDGNGRIKMMDFVEFLEMIGRAAHVKFRGSELEDLPLCRKIGFILADIFQFFQMQPSPVNVDIEEETASDSDY